MPSEVISIIVPVYNSSATLRRCLEAIFASRYRYFECIVVDDGSTDESHLIAQEFPAKLVRLSGGPFGPAYARNRGAEVAEGTILLFVDADVVVRPGTASELARSFSCHPEVSAIFGSYDDSPEPQDFLSQYKNLFHHFVHQQGEEAASTFWAGCGAVRREAFIKVKGFDERRYPRASIEDIELGSRLRSDGRHILLNKAIQAKHLKRWTLSKLLRSEIIDRGIAWTRLILRDRDIPNDLNLRLSQRLSAALACSLLPSLVIVAVVQQQIKLPPSGGLILGGVVSTALMLLIVLLNRELYAFFIRKRGLAFAATVVPFHFLYFLYSVFSFGLGVTLHFWDRLRHRWTGPRRAQPIDTP